MLMPVVEPGIEYLRIDKSKSTVHSNDCTIGVLIGGQIHGRALHLIFAVINPIEFYEPYHLQRSADSPSGSSRRDGCHITRGDSILQPLEETKLG